MTGFGLGAAYGILESSARRLSPVARATIVGLSAMAVTDGGERRTRDDRPAHLVAASVGRRRLPHLVYGLGVVVAYGAFGRS